MKKIKVTKESDYWECSDGCCSEWFEGVTVELDGEIIFKIPCKRGFYLDEESLYITILKKLGYKVEGDIDNIYG